MARSIERVERVKSSETDVAEDGKPRTSAPSLSHTYVLTTYVGAFRYTC